MTDPSAEIIAQVARESGGKTMLAFSRGKDAIAAWLAVRDHFDEVFAYHLYLVPGLEFIEESLAYYEWAFGVRIANLPHPSMARWFRDQTFQTPSNAAVLAAANMGVFSYQDIHQAVREANGLSDQVLAASGVRAADSPMRRVSIKTHGAISRTTGHYYPIWDWNKDRLLAEIEGAGIALPEDYDLFGRSFDGLDARFLVPLKAHRPRDYQTVLDWFPEAEAEVWRFERWGRA